MGNGPSLKNVDIHKLKGVDTFSFNRAYLAYEDWGFDPTFYACIDYETVKYCMDGVSQLIERGNTTKIFIPKLDCTAGYEDCDKVKYMLNRSCVWVNDPNNFGKFKINALPEMIKHSPFCDGSVVSWAVRLLYMLGYDQIGLVGVDCNYKQGADNYFVKGYDTPRGINYEAGNNVQRWRNLKKDLAVSKKLEVFLCTESPKLKDIFRYVPLDKFLKEETP